MKINTIFLCLAASIMATSCSFEKITDGVKPDSDTECPVSFTAYTEGTPSSKATIGESANGKPLTFWEDGDLLSVYSSGQDGQDKPGYEFSTELMGNSSSAKFKYSGNDFVKGEYIAVYPYLSNARVVRYNVVSKDDPETLEHQIESVVIPSSQTLVAGSFDRNAMVMISYSENLEEFHFKNAVSLVKFRVSGSDITSGTISASEVLAGTFSATVPVLTKEPVMNVYNTTDQSVKSVSFTAKDGAPLAPATDYYVAVRPTSLTNGFTIALNGVEIKSYSINEFKRNTIYDLGTLSLSDNNTLSMTFDFTDANAMAGWPQEQNASDNPAAQFTCPYEIDDITYNFISSRPLNVTTLGWPYYRSIDKGVPGLLMPKETYIGFPVVEGYALTSVQFTVGANNGAKYMITGAIAEGTATPVPVGGGDIQSDGNATSFIFNLTDTAQGTQYWMKVWNKPSVITSMALTYSRSPEPTPEPEPEPEPEPDPNTQLALTFDFVDATAMAGWPQSTAASDDPTKQIPCPYVHDGVTYNFISSRPLNVTSLQWPYYRGDGMLMPKQSYLGFPVVEGYTLTAVYFEVGTNNGANYMITGAIAEGTANPVPVGGGETQSDGNATSFTFNLTDTAPGTQYWMKAWSKPALITSMTLTYSK